MKNHTEIDQLLKHINARIARAAFLLTANPTKQDIKTAQKILVDEVMLESNDGLDKLRKIYLK